MIRIRSLLLTLALSGWAGGAGAAPLTVVAFNVESGGSSDRVIGRQLERSSDVDLWGLTEIYRKGGWVESLRVAAGVGETAGFGAVVGSTGQDNESLVLYRTDRLRLIASEELVAVTGDDGGAAPLVARFVLDGAEEFLFVVVRLADRAERRLGQAQRLAEWAAGQTLPVIAAGTFAFGVPEGGTTGDEAMATLLARTGWEWVRPADAPATACGRPRLVEDFVFAGGAARDWAGRTAVMFSQSNYCADGDSGRSSDHRPVIAGFHTDGTPGGIVGAMPEREIGPMLPGRLVQREAGEARDEQDGGSPPVIDAGEPPPVVEAGAAASVPSAAAPPAASPPAAPADPEREALLRRLEALEQEAEALRRALEAEEAAPATR